MRKRMSGSVLLLVTLAFSLIVGDVLVLNAQDPPANPPQTPQTQPPDNQTPKKSTSKKSTSKTKRADKTNTTATGDQTTTPADAMPAPGQTEPAQTPAQMPQTPVAPAQRANMAAEQTDLSGTYAGTFNCDALGLTGDTTLTVTGNQFTTADGKTGRIVASTTGGYTAVALQTGDVATGATAATGASAATGTTMGATAPTIVSLRARKRGNSLTLMPAAGSAMQCSFSPTRNVARSRRSQPTPAATGTEVASPAEAGPAPADVTAPTKPARKGRGNTRRTTTPSTMPNPTTTPANPTQPTPEQPTPEQPVPSQTPSPTPSPSPAPSGSPTPVPSPTPGGSPTPEPAPTATPNPTPSPSPSPSPGRPRG
jgi:hypothetical protein